MVVRMPATWRANRPPRPQVTATVGGKAPSGLGTDALLDFHLEVTLDGETLTAAEIKELLAKSDGLSLVRGRWVEVDRERLSRMLEHFQQVERAAAASGLSFGEAMRMLAGADVACRRRRAGRRLGASGRGTLAARNAEGTSQPGWAGPRRTRCGAERHAAALPAGGCALALSSSRSSVLVLALPMTWASARPSRCWRSCSCSEVRRRPKRNDCRACWWLPPRFWPIGPRKSTASRRA